MMSPFSRKCCGFWVDLTGFFLYFLNTKSIINSGIGIHFQRISLVQLSFYQPNKLENLITISLFMVFSRGQKKN
jgi:hypothetical protein